MYHSFDDHNGLAYCRYIVEGSGYMPLVFLHGLGGDLGVYEYYQERLQLEGVESLAIDLPGHGMSESVPAMVRIGQVAEQVREVVKQIGWKEYVLVGHCMGGVVAGVWSSRYANEVVRLVLLNSAVMETMPRSRAWLGYTSRWWKALARLLPHALGRRRTYSRYFGSSDFSLRRIGADVVNTSIGDYASMMAMMLAAVKNKHLAYFDGEVVLIGSDNDRIVPMEAMQNYSQWFGSSVVQVISGGSHVPLVNKPVEMMQLLREVVVLKPRR